MKKTLTLITASVLVVALTIGLAAAADEIKTFEPDSPAYVAPVLDYSVRPEHVYYTPSRRIEGYVTLDLKVGTSGNVEGVRVLYRTSKLAVKSAVRAVEKWKFKPAMLDGKPVTAYVAYSLPFGENLQIFANENYPDRVLDPVNGDQIAIK